MMESEFDVATSLGVVDLDPRLPVGLTTCERYGLAGLCGPACPAMVREAWDAGEDCADWLASAEANEPER